MKLGQVLLTEGERTSFVSRGIARHSGCWFTHINLITGPAELTEATFPRVRRYSLNDRMKELESKGRRWRLLDLDGLSSWQRRQIAAKGVSYVGRFYDVGQIALFMLTRAFHNDGEGTMVCSRLITAAYLSGAGIRLFPEAVLKGLEDQGSLRVANLRKGYATPGDYFTSALVEVDRG
jgi:uncharacterized protein YycO